MASNLIIRSSYSRLSNGELKSNFGDLIRSTVLLSCIGDDFLWLTDSRSVKLLRWFVDPDKLITYDGNLDDYYFPEGLNIYNIDNYIKDDKLFDKLKGRWHGYVKDKGTLAPANELISYTEAYKKINNPQLGEISWQQALVEGMGFAWEEQDFSNVKKAETKEKFDVGLNWHVHPVWESKHWPKSYWKKLEAIIKDSNSVSWQEGMDNFDDYISWLLSCKLVVTCDTLGLHLASALRKKVVAIVGPTENNEFSYGRVFFVKARDFDCMPCNQPRCTKMERCLEKITPEEVSKKVGALLPD